MLLAGLHDWVDRQLAVSAERWWLRAAAYASVIAVALAVERDIGGVSSWFVAVVGVIGLASVLGPDSQMSSLVILIVVWRWMATVDDPISWPVIVVAIGLHVYHSTLALLAAVPESAPIPHSVIARWIRRSAYAVGAAAATWLLTIVLDGRSFGGSAFLTAASLAIVAAGGVTLIGAVLQRDPNPSTASSSDRPGTSRSS